MEHDEARTLASARADGELDPLRAPELEAHLSACPDCAGFAAGIGRLAALASRLPEEPLPRRFAERVAARLRPRARPAWRARLGTLAAAAAVAIAVVVAGLPVRTFRVQAATAAEALLSIRTLELSREIEVTDFEGRITRRRERIRYRAPASVRIDSTDARGTLVETEIRLPGIRYRTRGGDGILERNRPPEANPVPEPLSPTLALVGREAGPGPVVAGRRTIRVVIDDPEFIRREALVDAERSTVMDHDVSVLLEKEFLAPGLRRIRKRTTSIRFNEPLERGVFDVPAIRAIDAGFRARPASDLRLAPSASPKGFRLVRSGTGPAGDALLYARGAFSILVQIGSESPGDRVIEERAVEVQGRPATVLIGVYDLPAIRFTVAGQQVTISAPATVDGLRELAAQMFAEGLE